MSNVPQQLDHRETESKSYFDQWAKTYDSGRISRWFQYTQNLALEAFELHPNSQVLDVGCGTGYATQELASLLPRGKACGIDLSFQMIREALRSAPADLQERIEFLQANSASIPYQDGTFTHLLCTNSFHHYPDPLDALKEMKRVLTPG